MKLQSQAFLTLPLRSLMRFIRFITLVKLAISSSLNDLCNENQTQLILREWVEKTVRHYSLQYKEPLFLGLYNPHGTNAKKARKTRSGAATSLGSTRKALFALEPTPISVCVSHKQTHNEELGQTCKCTANAFAVHR